MRVAILTDNDFGKANGVTTTLRAVVRHAPPEIRPRIYTLADEAADEPAYLALKAAGLPVPFCREMRVRIPRAHGLARQVIGDNADVIHITTPGPTGLAGKYLAARLGLPAIGSFHTQLSEHAALLTGSARLGSLMTLYLRWLYGTCSRVLVPSADTLRQLLQTGWDASRLAVWPRGVDTDLFSPSRRSAAMREAWGVSDERPAVLYAGRVSREKGLGRLVSVEAVLRHRRIGARVVVLGDGPMVGELRAQCPDAVFLGTLPHDQVGIVMASADLFLFPSDMDTAGNVVLEAQASGLPVLVSRLGGPREQMVDGETGFVCDPADSVDFAWRTRQLLTDPDRRKTMAAAARVYAKTRTWDAALEPLFASYRRAVCPARDGGSFAPLTPAGATRLR